jgi:predicted AlkP superfamily pyrophosphatase or phosphodiesterase
VFKSGLQAILGEVNPLLLKPKSKVLVILIDGLGAEQILSRSGHCRFLANGVSAGQTAFSAFPATTSTNIGSFATGLMPGEHGLVGHQVLDREHNLRINLLTGWNSETDPLKWQPNLTISELSHTKGVITNVIAAAEYENTGYTLATMREAQFLPAEGIGDRFDRALEVLNSREASLTYLYIPELDKYGHRNGWQSPGWSALLEEVDGQISRLAARLPKDCGVLVTSDHGMVDTSPQMHLVLDTYFDSSLDWFGGDTRVAYIYLNDESAVASVVSKFDALRNSLTAVPTADLVRSGFYGNVSSLAEQRLPEVVLFAKGSHTLFHSEYSKKKSFEMIAHHGSVTAAEIRIPLVRIGF